MSTQYLFQPFVWLNWPVDEVLAGWLEVLRDRVVVAVSIGLTLLCALRLPLRRLGARALVIALAIAAGAAIGEASLMLSGAFGAAPTSGALSGRIARWAIVG